MVEEWASADVYPEDRNRQSPSFCPTLPTPKMALNQGFPTWGTFAYLKGYI